MRGDSTSFKGVRFMRERDAAQLDIDLVLLHDARMFSLDLENDPPQDAMDFKHKVRHAEAVLFAVPEYNFSMPGVLKNAIDWMSRAGLDLQGKPSFIIGSSIGVFGSLRAQMHLREVLSNPALAPQILPGNEVYIGSVQDKLNEQGEVTDSATLDFLDNVVKNFVDIYNQTV